MSALDTDGQAGKSKNSKVRILCTGGAEANPRPRCGCAATARKRSPTDIRHQQWDNDAHANLCIGLTAALVDAGSSIHKHMDIILAAVNVNGGNFTNESIR